MDAGRVVEQGKVGLRHITEVPDVRERAVIAVRLQDAPREHELETTQRGLGPPHRLHRLHHPLDVSARVDVADEQDEVARQDVAPSQRLDQLRREAGTESAAVGAEVDDPHSARRQTVHPQDLAPGELRYGHDRVRPAGRGAVPQGAQRAAAIGVPARAGGVGDVVKADDRGNAEPEGERVAWGMKQVDRRAAHQRRKPEIGPDEVVPGSRPGARHADPTRRLSCKRGQLSVRNHERREIRVDLQELLEQVGSVGSDPGPLPAQAPAVDRDAQGRGHRRERIFMIPGIAFRTNRSSAGAPPRARPWRGTRTRRAPARCPGRAAAARWGRRRSTGCGPQTPTAS